MKAAKAAEKYAAISPWGTISFVTFLCGEQRKVYRGARLFGGQAGAESPATLNLIDSLLNLHFTFNI
jgi:hypothetical protein